VRASGDDVELDRREVNVANDRFHATWDARIGPEAADLLGKRARLLALIPVAFLAVTVSATVIGSGRFYWLVESLAVLVTLGSYLPLQARANRRLAAAMSSHLGFEVSPGTLPRVMTRTVFERLVREGEGAPRRERSFLGGFIRISLPPKED
jgi:hypothetical protein